MFLSHPSSSRLFPIVTGALLAAAIFSKASLAVAQQPGFTQLFSNTELSAPLPDADFSVPNGARPPSQIFEGRLELQPPPGYGYGKIISTTFDSVRTDLYWKQLPPFRLEFVQDATHLVPVQQGLILTGSPAWNLIVGAGSVWDQAGDNGYTRASLPFALIERSQNCVHNGELTFLFSNTQQPSISQVRYQITQETCFYMKVDMWGQVPAHYTHEELPQTATLKADFESELAQRVPTKPLSALARDFPDAHVDLAAFLRGRQHSEDVTTYGVYIKGIHYASNCPTRYGEYPFCSEMRLPSYSTAKSAFAGVAMMHLGQLFGPEVYADKLTAYLPNVGQDATWNAVSFSNALDMATGHFLSPGFERDEDGPEEKFLVDEDLDAKLKDALLTFPRKVPPGVIWDYQSHNTFLATVAMNKLAKEKLGPGADLFNLVRDDIYKPLYISQGMLSTLRTGNSADGEPEGYFGLFYIKDDVVKIARFLNESGGVLDGKPVLDPQRLRESLFRDPKAEGLLTGDPRQLLGTVRYNHAFWARHYTPLEYPQLPCDLWVPYMSGYGGISIVMLPNGVVFYIFSDAEEFVFNDAVLETNTIMPLCPTSK
jgi:hypothetical protein